MPDDPERPRHKRMQSMTERDIEADRRRRIDRAASHAIPVEIDPELTPAPASPPTPHQINQLPPAEALAVLAKAAADNSAAILHEQQVRREGEEMGSIKSQIQNLTVAVDSLKPLANSAFHTSNSITETVIPLLNNLGSEVAKLSMAHGETMVRRDQFYRDWERLYKTLGSNEERMRTSESEIERLSIEHTHLAGAHSNTVTRVDHLEARVMSHEIVQKVDRRVATALTKRDKQKIGVLSAIVTLISGGLSWLVQHFTK